MNESINEIAKKFKRKMGKKAQRVKNVKHCCYHIKITKTITKNDIVTILNKICEKHNFPKLRTDVPSPSVRKGKDYIGISSIANVKPFKEIAIFIFFKTND